MGYLLPDGELPASGQLSWFLVAVPDSPELKRAAMGAYTDLGKFWKWGAEGTSDKSNQTADLFNEAISETLRGIEMGFPDILLAYIDEIEDLLRAGGVGGGGSIESLPGVDSILSFDDTLIETSTTDQSTGTYPDAMPASEFETYLCAASVSFVDELIDFPDGVLIAAASGLIALLGYLVVSITSGWILLPAGALALLTPGGLIALWREANSLYTAVLDGSETTASNASIQLAAVRDDLICAIYTANTATAAAAAVSAIINSTLSAGWEALFALYPLESTIAKIFNHESRPPLTAYDCTACATPGYWADVYLGANIGGNTYESQVSGSHYVAIKFYTGISPDNSNPASADITVSNDSSYNAALSSDPAYRISSEAGVEVHASSTVYPNGVQGHHLVIKHIAAFTVDVTWTNYQDVV